MYLSKDLLRDTGNLGVAEYRSLIGGKGRRGRIPSLEGVRCTLTNIFEQLFSDMLTENLAKKSLVYAWIHYNPCRFSDYASARL